MTKDSLVLYLKCVGWASIVAYPLSRIAATISMNIKMQSIIQNDELKYINTGTQLLGIMFDVPLNLALPVLCLAAAAYLNKQEARKSLALTGTYHD